MNTKTKIVVFSVLGLIVVTGAFVLYQSGKVTQLFAAAPLKEDDAGEGEKTGKPTVYHQPLRDGEVPLPDGKGDPGLRITEATRKGLGVDLKAVIASEAYRPLPPQVGTINYDNETMFQIKPRFQGELISMKQVQETKETTVNGSTQFETVARPIMFCDRVKQGEELAVFWSITLGTQKAAFVDAISALRLSQETLVRQQKLYDEGALPLAALDVAKRQVRADNNTLLTAERTLRMWKMTDDEIKSLREEANIILDSKKPRDVVAEVEKWARVAVTVPWFDRSKTGEKRELTILEKNTNIGDIVDQLNYSTTLFKVADMSRLQIWVHPPEEYLPVIRKSLEKNGGAKPKWHIRFQADRPDKPPLVLDIDRIAPSYEPTQHNPMVVGYIDNKDYHYLVGQSVTATIYVAPEKDTVEIPTDALNEIKGQSFVFLRDPKSDEKDRKAFSCRRVAVVQRFKEFSIVRSKLTEDDEKFSKKEVKDGRWPLRPLLPSELVVTRGVVEMTTALENLLTRERAKELAKQE